MDTEAAAIFKDIIASLKEVSTRQRSGGVGTNFHTTIAVMSNTHIGGLVMILFYGIITALSSTSAVFL